MTEDKLQEMFVTAFCKMYLDNPTKTAVSVKLREGRLAAATF